MTRYQPTPDQQTAIDLLQLAGYAIIRRRTHTELLERVRVAEAMEAHAKDDAEHAHAWAIDQCTEQRRLADRLNRVCFAAAALGISIQDINTALDAPEETP